MVKKSLIVILLLASLLEGYAQGQFRKPLKSQGRSSNFALSKYAIGLKGGCPWSVMPSYDLQHVTYDGYFGYAAGLVIERYFGSFSIALEGLFSKKGTEMYYDSPYQISLNTTGTFHKDFALDFRTITARIPVAYYFKGIFKDDMLVPFLFLGAQVDYPLEKTTESTTTTTYGSNSMVEPNTVNLSPNASGLVGLGLLTRIPMGGTALLFKLDIAANYGLIDLAAQKFTLKNDNGCIRLHDIEANASIIVPIKKRLHDACYSFRRDKR